MDRTCGPGLGGGVRLLDVKTRALVRLGALIAAGGDVGCYRRHIAAAKAAGATDEDVMGTLLAVAPTIGMADLVAATTGVAEGLGYDIDDALERLDDDG